jgi:hypothetical protein
MPLPVESATKNNNGQPSKSEEKPGNKRKHRTMEEKLRKYEMRAEGHEFIPAMMHLLRRYCEDIPEDKKTGVDLKLA